jgi:prepilin-type N-terminal cleavage/methylation domain-containing protein
MRKQDGIGRLQGVGFDTHRHARLSFLEVMASCRHRAASCQRPKRNLQKERYTTTQTPPVGSPFMKRVQQGLTLIERMIVVPIMGILAAVAPPAFALYDDRKTQSYEMPDFIFSLYDRRTQNHFCHATRVSKDFLLTAAHCFFDGYKYMHEAGNTVLVSFSGEQVSYYPGIVREVILHPKYSEKERTIKELELKKKG